MDEITVEGLKFERGENEGGLYYGHTDPDTGIKWMVLRPACPEYCTPYWTCIVERGASLKTVTTCTELGDGKTTVDPLHHDVDHATTDPPDRLLTGVAGMIHQSVDPFGPGTQPWCADPQIPCPLELDAEVVWNRKTWKVTGREWRGRWLLTLLWPVNDGLVRDVPAHQVEPVTTLAGEQLRLL